MSDSDEKGENKRMVKKVKNAKTANIKISTEDPDTIQKNNKASKKNTKRQKTSPSKIGKKEKTEQKEEKKEVKSTVFQQTDLLNEEIKSLNSQIKKSCDDDLKELNSLTLQLTDLENQHNNLSTKSAKLMSKLKDIENKVSQEYSSKFNLSKMISNQKKLDNEINEEKVEKEEKLKDEQIKIEKKYIEVNKKQLEQLENLKKQAIDDKTLNEQFTKLNEEIKKNENELEHLYRIRNEHQNCQKIKSNLTIRLDILLNYIQLEKKVQNMNEKKEEEEKEKKIEKKSKLEEKKSEKNLKPLYNNMAYSVQIRKKALSKIEEKYSSKRSVQAKNIINYIKNELEEKKQENSSSTRNKNEKAKTIANTENYRTFLLHLKNDITPKIDNFSSPKKSLFSEKEKEVLYKYYPEQYMNNLNQRYNEAENTINSMEADANKKKKNIINKVNNKKVGIDEVNLKKKEMSTKIITQKAIISKNRLKIANLNSKIKNMEELIKGEEKKLLFRTRKNEDMQKIIDQLKIQKLIVFNS